MEPFRHSFRVRYSEIDAQAIVFNSRYLEYADLIVSEFFRAARSRGMPDVEFHVRKAEVDYLAPIRYEELVEGRLTVEAIGRSSMRTLVTLHGAQDGGLRAEIRLLTVHVGLPGGRPSAVPDAVRTALGFPVLETADG